MNIFAHLASVRAGWIIPVAPRAPRSYHRGVKFTVARCRVQRGALSTLRLVAGYNRVSQCSVRVSRSCVGANAPRCRVAWCELQALGSRRMLASLRRIVSASGVWPNLSLNPDAPRRRFAPSFVAPVSLVR